MVGCQLHRGSSPGATVCPSQWHPQVPVRAMLQFYSGRRSDFSHPLAARERLCQRLPGATLAALKAAADPALTADFRTILD